MKYLSPYRLIAFVYFFSLINFISFTQCIEGNCKNGYGIYKFKSGKTYAGNFVNGQLDGYGEYYDFGKCYIGYFSSGKMTKNITIKDKKFTNPDVLIGDQKWHRYNLNTTQFKNGDKIFYAKNLKEWNDAYNNRIPACTDYEFFDFNGEIFGKLYNWYAVNDSRGLAPSGYRIAAESDWNRLIEILHDYEWFEVNRWDAIVKKYAYPLKSNDYWNGTGSDVYGLRIVPGGRIDVYGFYGINRKAYYPLSGSFKEDSHRSPSRFKVVSFDQSDDISVGENSLYIDGKPGISVRCIKY